MFTIKVQFIQNKAHRLSTLALASYMITSGMTMQENQLAAQIAARHNIFSQLASYMSCIFLVLVGIDPGSSRLGGELVCHNTADVQHCWELCWKTLVQDFSAYGDDRHMRLT